MLSTAPKPLAHHVVFSTLLAGLAILLLRRPDAAWQPQFFAADGTVLFAEQYAQGLGALFLPHEGCLQLLPRLIAQLASYLPLEQRPAAYCYSGFGLLLGLGWLMQSARMPLPNRNLFALAPLLAPVDPFLFGHLASTQWFAGLGMVALLIQRPADRQWLWLADSALLLLLGLTGPFALLMVLLWPVRAVYYGTNPRDTLTFALLAGAAMTQSHFMLTADAGLFATGSFAPLTLEHTAKHLAQLVLGQQWPDYLGYWNRIPALGFVVVLFLIVLQTPRKHRFPSVLFALLGASAALIGAYHLPAKATAHAATGRLFLVPIVCATYCGLLGLQSSELIRRLAQGLLFSLVLSSATRFALEKPKDLQWASYCDAIRSGSPTKVPIPWSGTHLRLNAPSRQAGPKRRP